MGLTALSAPIALDTVAGIESRSERLVTPTGAGDMVWHRWGDGPAVVLLHGGYGSWTHWIRNVEQLTERYSVLAADLPGLGDSASPAGDVTVAAIAEVLVDGLRRLVPAGGRYHVVGFSFGGAVSGPLALADPLRVRSVTIVGSGGLGHLRPRHDLESWRQERNRAVQAEIHRRNLATLMFADPANIDELAVRLQADNTVRARLKSRPMARTRVLADVLPLIGAPIGAIYGELDANVHPFLPKREAELRELRPDIDFRVIPGAGHWVQYEAADRFNAVLLEMLLRHERMPYA